MRYTLYTYYRSSAAYRARIALALKGLAYQSIPVHLGKGEQQSAAYQALNSQKLVPLLIDHDHDEHDRVGQATVSITQSLAIIEYLEETNPEPALLPQHPADRALARQIALTIACDIHPLNNLKVLNALRDDWQITEEERNRWYLRWIAEGFTAVEQLLGQVQPTESGFSLAQGPGLIECCLVPQVFNARRFNADLSAYPRIVALDALASAHPAIIAAHPNQQADAQP